MESRAMLAADFFIGLQPDLSDHTADESLTPALILPAGGDSAEFDSAGNLAGIWFEVMPMNEPDQEYLQKGTTLWLRLYVDSFDNPLNPSDEIRVFIQYDSAILVQSGDIVLAENVSCQLDGESDFEKDCWGASQPSSRELLLEVPMLVISEGSANITITVLRSVPKGDFDVTEVVFTETTKIVAGSSNPDDLGPEFPDGVTPNSGGLFVFPLPSPDSDRPRPSLTSGNRSLESEDTSEHGTTKSLLLSSARTEELGGKHTETLTIIGKRDRHRPMSWEWYMADDATANLFRPLAIHGDVLKDAPAVEGFGSDVKFLVAHAPSRHVQAGSAHEGHAEERRISEATDAVIREIFAGVKDSPSERLLKLNPSSNPVAILQTTEFDSVLAQWQPQEFMAHTRNTVDKNSSPRRPAK